MGSNSAMRVLTQQFDAKIRKHQSFTEDFDHYRRTSNQRARDLDRDVPSSMTARDLFARKPMEMCRNGICVGEMVSVLVGMQILSLEVSSFEHGARTVLIDKRGYFHWAEPSQDPVRSHGAQFIATMPTTVKKANGYKPHPLEVVMASIDDDDTPKLANRRHARYMR